MTQHMFQEYDTFRLRRPLLDESVPVGTIGVVLMVHDAAAGVYEVEFPNGAAGNLGIESTYPLSEESMEATEA